MVCGTRYFFSGSAKQMQKGTLQFKFFCERDSDVSITSVYPKNERADNFGGEWHQPARKKVKSEARCVIRNKHSKKQRRRHSTHCVVLCQRRCASFWLDLCFPHAETHGCKVTLTSDMLGEKTMFVMLLMFASGSKFFFFIYLNAKMTPHSRILKSPEV